MISYVSFLKVNEILNIIVIAVWTTESSASVTRKEIELDDNILESSNNDIKVL